MPGRDIIVMGASAGGVTALRILLPLLPHDLPAALFLVLHRRSLNSEVATLHSILSQNMKLKMEMAQDSQPFCHGHVYLAPPDTHVLVERGLVRIERSPAENLFR